MSEEFFLVLSGNVNREDFYNEIGSYVTELPERIVLSGSWEVALTEIHFPYISLYLPPRTGHCAFWTSRKFTDGIGSGGCESTMKRLSSDGVVYKRMTELIDDINAVLSEEQKKHMKFVFEDRPDNYGIVCFRRECEGCTDKHVVDIDETLIRVLGFNSRTLPFHLELTESVREIRGHHPPMLPRGIPGLIFIYCDIDESSNSQTEFRTPFDYRRPLKSVIMNDTINLYGVHTVSASPNPPKYIPLIDKSFRTIKISMSDEVGQGIPFECGTPSVKLHFRKVD